MQSTIAPPAYDMFSPVIESDYRHLDEKVQPPAYDPADSSAASSVRSPTPPTSTASCTSSQTSTSKTLTIPTSGRTLSSGLPYHSTLADFDILPTDWYLFTLELSRAASPTSSQKLLASLVGLGTACVILDPWTSTLVGKRVLRSLVISSIRQGLAVDQQRGLEGVHTSKEEACCEKGRVGKESVGAVLRRWNKKWAIAGLTVGVEPVKKNEGGYVDGKKGQARVSCCGRRKRGEERVRYCERRKGSLRYYGKEAEENHFNLTVVKTELMRGLEKGLETRSQLSTAHMEKLE